jgi:hypothetical protein
MISMDVIHRDTVSIRLQRGDGDVVKQFPDEQTRILALYAWFGSGEGPLSGFPSYEMVAEELLLYSQTEALIETAKATKTAQQLEGAARLFGGWTFRQSRPSDLARLPPNLKQRLLVGSGASRPGKAR